MNTVDIGKLSQEITVGRLQACHHFEVKNNPLFSGVPNVGIGGVLSFVLVVEERKIKLVCWACMKNIQVKRLKLPETYNPFPPKVFESH